MIPVAGRVKIGMLLLFIIFTPGLSIFIRAQKSLILKNTKGKYPVDLYLEIFEDPTRQLSVNDVRSLQYSSQFKTNTEKSPNFGFTRSAYWVRFNINNESSFRSPWILELGFPNMHYADFYLFTSDGKLIKSTHTGKLRPLETRDIIFQNMVFSLVLTRIKECTVYARFANNPLMILPLTMWSTTEYTKKMQGDNIFIGFFVGILLMTAGYNLFLFLSLRDRSYLYYTLAIISLLFFTLSYTGLTSLYLWPNVMWLNLWSQPLFNFLLIITVLKFADSFLQLRIRLKRIHFIIYILMAITTLFTLTLPLTSYHFFILHMAIFTALGLFIIIGAGIISYQKGFKPARYFLLGFSAVGISGILIAFTRLQIIPSYFFSERAFVLSTILLIWFLSQALAHRIKLLRQDKEKADYELKKSEERIRILSRAMEQSPALVIITNLEGNIDYVNPKFVQITGYTLDEIRGKNPRILKSGTTPRSTYKELWETITSGNEWQGEFYNKKKNGELYWESAYICPIKNEIGEITHYLGLKEDITEKKKLQEQLIQIQKMESIGALAGGIAHDFNNILTVIKGYSDIIMRKLNRKNPLYKDISLIRSAGEKAENLTRQILTFSRKQVYQPKIIDINLVISDLEKMIRRMIGEDINIKMSLAPDLPRMKADPNQIEQIFVNLIVNAQDAIKQNRNITSDKSIIIETGQAFLDWDFVRKNIGSQYGLHVYFSVSDSGIGMSDITKQKIFDPFFTTKDKGTGLGLATIYGIVKQNLGNIFVYSEERKGTTFKIYWSASEEQISPDIPSEIEEELLTGNEVILVAEDDENVAMFSCSALKDAGYKVYVAKNGKEALDLVIKKNINIDLLLTDLVMPDMNGEELAHKIMENFPDIPVLFTSGYSDDLLKINGQLKQKVNFLQKPYSITSLLKKIRDILKPKSK